MLRCMESLLGTNRRLEVGQRMYSLPGYLILQLFPLLPKHHPPKKPWVQPNIANPLGNEARIVARCFAAFCTAATSEQELAGPLVGDFQIVIDRLAGLFGQFKSDWPSRLLLSHRCTVRRVSARSDILDLDRD